MHNLNLYSYYDKSLADVNREYLESLKNKPKRVSRSKLNKKVALAAAITLATGLIIANYLGVFSEKVVEVVEAPPPVDTRTEEEKQGYVQIQIFEFADTPVETITEPATQNDNYTGKVIQTAKAENITKPAVNNSKEAEKVGIVDQLFKICPFDICNSSLRIAFWAKCRKNISFCQFRFFQRNLPGVDTVEGIDSVNFLTFNFIPDEIEWRLFLCS